MAPNYSKDGKYIAYISKRPATYSPMGRRYIGNVLCIKSNESGKVRVVRTDLDMIGFPIWSPDGESIGIASWNVNNVIELYLIDVQSEKITLISKPDENHGHFGGHMWSPSGNTFYYGLRDINADRWNIIERDLISVRTKEGLKAVRARGVKLGRPRGVGRSKLDAYREEITALLNNGATKTYIAKRYKTSQPNLYNWLKKNQINLSA